jgi:hypothetical protein
LSLSAPFIDRPVATTLPTAPLGLSGAIAYHFFPVYIVLGVLYESLIHRLTLLSTPPSAGVGAEMRRPLGIAIVGGLLLSQLLTLYTTPVMYLYLDRFRLWREAFRSRPRTPSRTAAPVPTQA